MSRKVGDRPELLTKEEMNRLMLTVSGDIYFNTLYNCLLHTGRRIGELYGTKRGKELTGGIRVKDIDFDARNMTTIVLKTKKRKLQNECPNKECSEKNSYKATFCYKCGTKLDAFDRTKLKYSIEDKKTIPLKPEMVIILKNYITKQGLKQNSFLFREFSGSYVKHEIGKHCKTAGVTKKFSIHGFRHYFVSRCIASGMPTDKIMKWTGHVSRQSLDSYNQLIPRDVEEDIMKVDL